MCEVSLCLISFSMIPRSLSFRFPSLSEWLRVDFSVQEMVGCSLHVPLQHAQIVKASPRAKTLQACR